MAAAKLRAHRVGVVSISIAGYDPQEAAALLDASFGVQVRAGLHCAPLVHRALGTLANGGTVRFSLGAFNTAEDVDAAIALRIMTTKLRQRSTVNSHAHVALVQRRTAFQVHPVRRLLHRHAGLRVGEPRRNRRPGQTSSGFRSKPSRQQYVRKVGSRKSLIEFENGDCVFFDGKTRKCNVYEFRPQQCRTWPFWDSNIATPEAWKETCQVCPGSGHGKLYSVEEVLAQSSVIKI